LAEELDGKVVFVGVSNRDTVADGKAYADRFEVPYPLAHSPRTWELFDIPYQPVTIVLDRRHEVAERFQGPVGYDQLREALKNLRS
jgi:hypothetical protein